MPRQPNMQELAPAIAHSGSPLLFALAGAPIATALIKGNHDRDTDTIRLLDAMERRLADVARACTELVHGPVLVQLSGALAVLSLARPHLQRGIRHLLAELVDRTPPSAWLADRELLPLRGLVALSVGRDELAKDTALELDRRQDETGAMVLRWAAAQRRRGQRASRLQSLHTLTRRLGGLTSPVVLAAAAAALPEPSRSVAMVAPRRMWRPATH